jgi:RNA polymerase sigma-70 factor (ECF subfamily)
MRRAAEPSDADLVHRSLAGQREAFALLYDRHARLVRVVAADAGPAHAEDVVQDVFLRAWRNLAALRAPERFAPWLVGIARKVVRETRRHRRGQPLPAVLPDPRPNGNQSADAADEANHLRHLVARLPEEERLAVQFFFLAERNVAEVARTLGRSRSGTYALIRQALSRLMRWMGAEGKQGEVTR